MVGEASVSLDTMSGFDFEEFTADLLTRLGYGKVERVLFTQDGGRDILIRSLSGLIVVECKHQPNTSIGRPIVQKLHSAVLTSKAFKGMLVTTGRFTKEANDYARLLASDGTIIEMIDRPILGDMASRAGIRLIARGENLGVWTYSLPSKDETSRIVGSFVASNVRCNPNSPQDYLTSANRTVNYRPVYLVTYNINAVFETSVGVIHTERANGATLVFDGNNGTQYRDEVYQFLQPEPQVHFTSINNESSGELPTFRIDFTTLQKKARDTITKVHTRTIRYHGKNNVGYSKVCEPGERDIYISDIRQVYLPLTRIDFSLRATPYALQGVLAPSGRLMATSHDVNKCRICDISISKNTLLCDVCGRVTHSGGFRLGSIHGFSCGQCQRTTCRIDGYWSRRFLIWRTLLCPSCAEKRDSRKVRKLIDRRS